MPIETFFFILTAVLLEHSIMFHSRSLRVSNAAMIFFISAIKPLKWPYPIVPLVIPKNYDLMRSPFPILGCIKDDLVFVTNTWNSSIEPNLVHVDLDNNYQSTSLKYRLEKLLKNSKHMQKVKENYEKLQKTIGKETKETYIDASKGENLYVVELLVLLRSALNDIFFFDDSDIRQAPDKKAYVLLKSKLADAAAHKALLNGQLFANFHQ